MPSQQENLSQVQWQKIIGGWFLVTSYAIYDIQRGKTWIGVKPMASSQVWKALLKQHDKLKKQASGTTFDRITLLKKVSEDSFFLAATLKDGKVWTEELDSRVSDTCANITELFQMLKMFPKKAQWVNGDLSTMRTQMLEKIREEQQKLKGKKTNGKAKKPGPRKTATLYELRETQVERDRFKLEAESSQKITESVESSLDTAKNTIAVQDTTIASQKAEIGRLKTENRKLKTAARASERRLAKV
jgi:hypothetical protein